MTTTAARPTAWERFRADVQSEVLASLADHSARLTWTPVQVQAVQRDGLRALLAHAKEHSPFHRERLAEVNACGFELSELASLPVMTKADMMSAFDDVVTDRGLSLGLAESALAATEHEPVPILGKYVVSATGGSSGRRGVFVFDRSAKAHWVLSILRSLMARLAASGGPPPGGLTFAMAGAASAVHPTGSAAAESAGPGMPIRIVTVPVTLPWGQLIDRLNDTAGDIVGGYPSVLVRLAAERQAGHLKVHPKVIVSTSETLYPHLRAAISAGFGAPVVDSFGCTEGLFGSSAPNAEVLTFNTDLCIAELVDADNRPVELGRPSAKVLLTNLYNRTQPLIRYELPDVFIADGDGHGLLRARVQGRTDEVLNYPGVVLHPHVIRSVLVQTPDVADYQVRQTPTGIHLDLLPVGASRPGETVDADAVARRLRDALAQAGLVDPDVCVRLVGMLDRQPDSGKLSRFVPLAGR